MNEMALIVPSRGRPENIVRLKKALQDTKSKVDLYVGVDADDSRLDDYIAMALLHPEDVYLIVSEERKRFGPTLNSIAVTICDQYDYLAWMGDDHLPKTERWDQKYRDILQSAKVGVVYGRDGYQDENIATALAFTSNIVKELGYAVPPKFTHLFIDDWFMTIARSIDSLYYVPSVLIEHLHPAALKSEQDDTYREANCDENWTNDRKALSDWKDNFMESSSIALRNLKNA